MCTHSQLTCELAVFDRDEAMCSGLQTWTHACIGCDSTEVKLCLPVATLTSSSSSSTQTVPAGAHKTKPGRSQPDEQAQALQT